MLFCCCCCCFCLFFFFFSGWKSGTLVKFQTSHVMKNPYFAYAKKKTQISLRIRAVWSSSLIIAAQTEQCIQFLYPKFQASSYNSKQSKPVRVFPGRKTRRQVFSLRSSDDKSAQSDQSLHCPPEDRILSYSLSAQRRLWSDWASAQADLSLPWAQMPIRWFCHDAAEIYTILMAELFLEMT